MHLNISLVAEYSLPGCEAATLNDVINYVRNKNKIALDLETSPKSGYE